MHAASFASLHSKYLDFYWHHQLMIKGRRGGDWWEEMRRGGEEERKGGEEERRRIFLSRKRTSLLSGVISRRAYLYKGIYVAVVQLLVQNQEQRICKCKSNSCYICSKYSLSTGLSGSTSVATHHIKSQLQLVPHYTLILIHYRSNTLNLFCIYNHMPPDD